MKHHTVARFQDEVQLRLGPVLADFGFSLIEVTNDSEWGSVIYGTGSRSIEAFITVHLRDIPLYANIVLREGGLTWPERDWNGIALWQLAHSHADTERKEGYYPLDDYPDVVQIAELMKQDVIEHAYQFLIGDLSEFRRVRSELVKSRESYKIRSPEGVTDEPNSVEMKRRFLEE